MFFKLILENANGDRVDMTATANQYMTSKIEGLSPPPGTISTSSYAGMDGSYLNNAFIEKRNVVISFEMRGIGVEKRRHQLYKVVKPSRYVKIYYKTAGIDVFTEGYVETCEVSNFEQLVTGQISILCPDIYWYSTTSVMAYYSQITGDLRARDIVTITTKTGNKTVTLDRGGVKTNIINRLVSGSTWLTLREGRNRFYLRGTGLTKLRVKIIHTNAYLGV